MLTLDDLLQDRGPISMIKTDCDGYDLEVLQGAAQTLKSWRPLLYMEFSPGLDENIQAGLEWLQRNGYDTMYCLEPPDATFLMKTQDPAIAVAAARRQSLDYLDVICPPDEGWKQQLDAVFEASNQGRR